MKLPYSTATCLGIGVALLVGCSPDERLAPTGSSTSTAPQPSSSASSMPTAPARTVTERSPYGNVESDNLLWDGDFEWSSAFTDQYGWIDGSTGGPPPNMVVGAACKSGVKCLRLAKSKLVVGLALSSQTAALESSMWVHFETKDGDAPPKCSTITAALFDLGGGVGPDDPEDDLTPETESPDASGWCHLTGASPVRHNKSYLYIENDSKVSALIDDCVVRAKVSNAGPPASPAPPLGASHDASLGVARAAVRAARLPQDGKPNPARDAFQFRMNHR